MERPDLSSYLFPLLIKSVRVLNSFPIQFSMINRRSEPALSSIFIGLLSYSKLPLNPLKDRLKSKLVGSSGLEPPTSRLSGARSNQLSYEPMADRGFPLRPPCPSLSSPSWVSVRFRLKKCRASGRALRVVEMMGFEPMTPCLQGRCSPN